MGDTPTSTAASPSSSVRSRVEYAADVSKRSLDGCELLAVGGSESNRLNPLRPADADRDGTKRSLYTGGLLGLCLPPDIPPRLPCFTPDSRVLQAQPPEGKGVYQSSSNQPESMIIVVCKYQNHSMSAIQVVEL